MNANQETQRFIAMVAASTFRQLDLAAIEAEIGRRFAPLGLKVEQVASGREENPIGTGLLFTIDGVMITVLFVPQPIPPSELQDPIAGSRILWPDAAKELANHAAHVIVGTVNAAADHNGALNAAAYVSIVTSAVAALVPAIGVYWASGRLVTSAKDFVGAASGIAERKVPVESWIRIDFLEVPPDGIGVQKFAAMTTGLRIFVGREIEFLPAPMPPADLALRLIGTLQYLIMNGVVIRDSETLGISAEERIRVRHVAQGQRPGVPVLQLTLEQAHLRSGMH